MAAFGAISVPLAYFAIFTFTISLSPKHAITTRLAAAVGMAGLLYAFCDFLMMNMHSPAQRAPLITMLWVSYVSATEMLLVSRVDAAELSELSIASDTKPALGTASLLWNALSLYFNFRRAGTKWAIRNIPATKPQSRMRFIATTAPIWVIGYAILNLVDHGPLPELRLVAVEKQTLWRLWDLSAEDVIFRLTSCLLFWLMTLTLIWLVYYSGALITVSLGLSSPEAWPPIFGPVSSAYTLRRFWGKLWHQSLRAPLVGWAGATLDMLQVSRTSWIRSHLVMLLVFMQSGLLHHTTDVAIGVGHRQLSALTFFCLQPLGILAETIVQRASANSGLSVDIRKAIGYTWVVAFMWWSTAVLFYPAARLQWVGEMSPFFLIPALQDHANQ